MSSRTFLRVAAAVTVVALGLTTFVGDTWSARESNVRQTKHNLSSSGPATLKATTETQVCVFCHTPHGATPGVTPLWNRQLSTQTYTPYTSATLDANVIEGQLQQPGGTSKLCLSCHDGSLAIGNVNVLNGTGSATTQGTVAVDMQGTGTGGTMPGGPFGEISGFTRKIGIDLRNDHPISLTFTDQLAVRDGELRRLTPDQRYPADGSVIGVRTAGGVKPKLPLERTGPANQGQVQCGTCHDPHLRETDLAKGNQKFLRQSRFQNVDPATTLATTYTPEQDIICIGCHEKNVTPGVWAYSAHANPLVADEIYKVAAAQVREFPDNTRVWQAACLNCHDTHTVQGARRLLREGTDSVGTPKQGGNSAIEETCYQCHTLAGDSVLNTSVQVPNIKTDFLSPRRMPISNADQGGTEVHEISASFNDPGFIDCSKLTDAGCGADFLESRDRLAQRHAECTDCHNPHRVVKFQSGVRGVLAGAPEKAGTHRHEDAAGYVHNNLISGVLRGGFGVEPTYANASFQTLPSSFIVKRGDPATTTVVAANDNQNTFNFVTREYQICLKCHSNYGYNDDNIYPNSLVRPQLGINPGLTPAARTSDARIHTSYTNQAKEFQAPLAHRGDAPAGNGLDAGAATAFSTNNHRSWHPVMNSTGRTARGGAAMATIFRAPWSNAGGPGNQTMYCSDCHGSDTTRAAGAETAMPTGNTNANEDGNPWGPHGSANDFLLKGLWNTLTGTGQQANGVCFKCHNYASYATRSDNRTGFFTDKGDGHTIHADKIGRMRCSWCHVAVPHGWKNKALLVNLNDVGPEVGIAPGTQVRTNTTAGYTNGPYYMNAMNKIRSFARSGQWTETNCGSAGAPGNGQSGRDWMRDSNENCANPP